MLTANHCMHRPEEPIGDEDVPLLEISSILLDVLTANLWNAGLMNHHQEINIRKPWNSRNRD